MSTLSQICIFGCFIFLSIASIIQSIMIKRLFDRIMNKLDDIHTSFRRGYLGYYDQYFSNYLRDIYEQIQDLFKYIKRISPF